MGWQVRRVLERDWREWLRLRQALWPDDSTEGLEHGMHDTLSRPEREPVWVAERPDGGLCGMAEVSLRGEADGCSTSPVGYLEGWYVDPDVRRQGVGRRLVEAGEEWAREHGCREMGSDTDPNCPLSPAAHAALGYEQASTPLTFRKSLAP